MPGRILKCGCKHSSQDKLHGEGNRVFNQTKEQDGKVWRCSVCLKTTSFGEGDKKK